MFNDYDQIRQASSSLDKDRTSAIKNSRLWIPPYIVVEGNVAVGKTTLTERINTVLAGSAIIKEYADQANWDAGETFPAFPPKSREEVLSSNVFWIDLENRRIEKQIHANEAGKTMQIVDRSPLSLMAFEYAKWCQGILADISDIASRYIRLCDEGIYKEPAGYIHLTASVDTIHERIGNSSGLTLPFLYKKQTIDQIDRFITYFLKNCLQPEQYLVINNDNPNLVSLETICSFMEVAVAEKDYRKQGLYELCSNLVEREFELIR